MSDSEYKQFEMCRQTKFFSKGFQSVLEWLGLQRKHKGEDTCLRDRKTLEMFGYVVRTVLQRIVIEAVRLN